MQATSSTSSSTNSASLQNHDVSSIRGALQSMYGVHSTALTILKHILLKTNASLSTNTPLKAVDFDPVYHFLALSTFFLEDMSGRIKNLYASLKITNKEIKTLMQAQESALAVLKTQIVASSTWDLSNSLLGLLPRAIHRLRQDKDYTSEYLIRELFTHLVHLNLASSPEEIRKAIEFEQEHLDSLLFFSDGSENDQKRYNEHLSRCLSLVARQTGLVFKSETFNEQLEEVIIHLSGCLLKPEFSLTDLILMRKSLAFFCSRPEWLFYQDFLKAKNQLREAKQEADDQLVKNQIELQSIVLETNQATRFEKGHRQDLLGLINRIDVLLKSSPSNAVIALSARARICEFLAKESAQPENLIRKLLDTLSLALNKGEEHIQELDFKALQALTTCRFLFGFYYSFCFKTTEEYERGRAALSNVAKDFWMDKETKEAVHLLNEFFSSSEKCPDPVSLKKENFTELLRFKWMLLGKVCALYSHTDPKIFKDITQRANDEVFIEKKCKGQFISSFFKNDVQATRSVINRYLSFHVNRTEQLIRPHYEKPFPRFMTFKLDSVDSGSSVHELKDGSKAVDIKQANESMQLGLDEASLDNVLMQSKEYPLIGLCLVQHEFDLIENILQEFIFKVSRTEKPKNRADSQSIAPFSNLQLFRLIYEHVEAFIEKSQGQIGDQTFLSSTMQSFLKAFHQSKQIQCVLGFTSPVQKEAKRKMFNDRHHLPTLGCCIALVKKAYQWIEHHTANPLHPDVEVIFECVLNSEMTEFGIAKTNKQKITVMSERLMFLAERYHQIIQETPSDHTRLECLQVQILFCRLLITTLLDDDEEEQDLRNEFLSQLGKTQKEIIQALVPSKPFDELDKRLQLECDFIIKLRALHLIENREIDAGIALCYKGEKNDRELISVEIALRGDFINLKKIREGFYAGSPEINLEMPKSSPEVPDSNQENVWKQEEDSRQLETRRIRQEANEILQKRLLKKEKKEAKAALNSPSTTAGTPVNVSTSSVSTLAPVEEVKQAPSRVIRKQISKKAMDIFNCLWQENAPSDGSWETCSFRNDVKMTRKDALVLIKELGGHYSDGKGSHGVVRLPSLQFNGKEVGGIISWKSGKIIVLTKDKELKKYQIRQLRTILLEQGFNPDTVSCKEKDAKNS